MFVWHFANCANHSKLESSPVVFLVQIVQETSVSNRVKSLQHKSRTILNARIHKITNSIFLLFVKTFTSKKHHGIRLNGNNQRWKTASLSALENHHYPSESMMARNPLLCHSSIKLLFKQMCSVKVIVVV